MAKSLNELGTTALDDNVDVTNLPEQGRVYPDPPQPGSYRWQLPRLDVDQFEAYEVDGKKYVRVKFDEAAPLTIVQSPGGKKNGEPFETSVNNKARERGKKGSGTFASDWDYLNQALKETSRPKSNKEFAERLIAKGQAQAQFSADVEWSWRCAENRPAYFEDGNGGVTTVMNDATGEPHAGCGQKYYQKDVQKVNGEFPTRIVCKGCNAQLRAFGNLTRFRA